MLFFILASMTAAATFVVLWALGRGQRAVGGGSDLLVYKDQLQEIDRDRAAGLIGEAEAEAARLEVSRRLLAAADRETPAVFDAAAPRNLRRRRAAALAALIILPFGSAEPLHRARLAEPSRRAGPRPCHVTAGKRVGRGTRRSGRGPPCAQSQ